MVKKLAKSAGRKRGPKPKGGCYYQISIRVADAATLDLLAALSPEQRGAAMLAGMQQVKQGGA